MSPASYLTAPPRVATGSIPAMEAFLWAALGFFVARGGRRRGVLGLRAWRAWQDFTSLAAAGAAGAELLASGLDGLAAHSEQTSAQLEELAAATTRMQRAIARARILQGATGEVLELVRAVRSLVPGK